MANLSGVVQISMKMRGAVFTNCGFDGESKLALKEVPQRQSFIRLNLSKLMA
jgi:hypothetical protein